MRLSGYGRGIDRLGPVLLDGNPPLTPASFASMSVTALGNRPGGGESTLHGAGERAACNSQGGTTAGVVLGRGGLLHDDGRCANLRVIQDQDHQDQ